MLKLTSNPVSYTLRASVNYGRSYSSLVSSFSYMDPRINLRNFPVARWGKITVDLSLLDYGACALYTDLVRMLKEDGFRPGNPRELMELTRCTEPNLLKLFANDRIACTFCTPYADPDDGKLVPFLAMTPDTSRDNKYHKRLVLGLRTILPENLLVLGVRNVHN